MDTSSLRRPDGSGPSTAGRLRPLSLARIQRQVDVPTRWTLLVFGAWVLYRTRDAGLHGLWPWLAGAYALLAIGATVFWFLPNADTVHRRAAVNIAYASYFADALFVCALIWRDGGLGSPLYVLLVFLALKALGLSPLLRSSVWLPFAFGPLYIVALWLASGSLSFLTDSGFLSRYLMFWIWLIGVVLVGYELARRTRQAYSLDAALAQQQAALAQKTEVLQRTATDLGDRLLELRSLQEVAKALATTLSTEETLQLVVATLAQVTGSSHCAVALIDRDSPAAAREGAALEGALLSDELIEPIAFRVPLADEPSTLAACESSQPLLAPAGSGGNLGARLGGHPYFVTALISRGSAIGALYVADQSSMAGRPDAAPSLNTSKDLLTSFAYFAATATENARLYQDAYEKRRELEAVLAGIGDGVVVADTDLSLLLVNPVARDILGLASEPPGSVPLRPYLAVPAFADLLSQTLSSRQEQIRELDLPAVRRLPAGAYERTDGGLRTYGALASPILAADAEVSGVVAVLRDVTAQKEVERMKSNFLSVVSHELRTPLHSIKGFVEIILMGKTGPVTELQEDFLRTVSTQTAVLQRMIDDLLEFSRMGAGRIKLNLEEISVAAIVQGVGMKLAPLAEEGGLALRVSLPDDLPVIQGDRTRLEQVFTNLVENAIKFTPPHGEVAVSGEHHGDRVRVTVCDTGIGIPPGEQEKVFDLFYRPGAEHLAAHYRASRRRHLGRERWRRRSRQQVPRRAAHRSAACRGAHDRFHDAPSPALTASRRCSPYLRNRRSWWSCPRTMPRVRWSGPTVTFPRTRWIRSSWSTTSARTRPSKSPGSSGSGSSYTFRIADTAATRRPAT